MILPLGDAPNPRTVPYVTYALLLANVGVFLIISLPMSATAPDPRDPLLQTYLDTIASTVRDADLRRQVLAEITSYDLFIFANGFRPAQPSASTLLTSLFLHASIAHLFGNMLYLWIYADNVEHRLGRLAFLGAYIASGIAATVFYSLFDLGSKLPLIGASGAISGVLGLYFIWFPRNQVRLFVFLFPFLMRTVHVPARLVLGVYVIVDNLLPFVIQGGAGGGVAHGAHIGGFFAGLLFAWTADRRAMLARPAEFDDATTVPPAPARAIREALGNRQFERAAEVYFSLAPQATHRLLSADDSLTLGAWLRRAGHPHAALAVFRRHVRDYPSGPGLAEAHLGAGLLQLNEFDQPTPAYQHILAALESNPDPETAQEARRALAAIDAHRKRNGGV